MRDQQTAVTEWDAAEQAEETGAPTLGRFLEGVGAALWPILLMALIFIGVVVWAILRYR